MKNDNHLSLYGIGPLYVSVCAVITFIICLFDQLEILPSFSFPLVIIILRIASVVCFVIAAILWLNAAVVQKIQRHIINNELVTVGAYAWVRNPIYSAIMFVMWAFLAMMGNLYLLLVFPIYPSFMTVLLKHTEEKWLKERYGKTYLTYCKNVNRCFPWVPKR